VDQLLCLTIDIGSDIPQPMLYYIPRLVLPYHLAEPLGHVECTFSVVALKASGLPIPEDHDFGWGDSWDRASASRRGAGMAFKLWRAWEHGDVWLSVNALKRVPGAVPVAFCGETPVHLMIPDVSPLTSFETDRTTWAYHGTSIALPIRSEATELLRILRASAPNDAQAAAWYAQARTDPSWLESYDTRWSLPWGKLKLIRLSPNGPPRVCDVVVPGEVASRGPIEAVAFDAALGLVYLQEDALQKDPREVYCLSYA
jgi:hypothetical protein